MAARSDSSAQPPHEPGMLAQWWGNRTGMAGLILSLLQFLVYGLVFGFTEYLQATGQADRIQAGSWHAWLLVGLLLLGTVTTMVGLFLSLQGSIHGRPRTPAFIGLALSLFTGTLVTFVLLLTALASGSQP